jgi:hypothetical protein
MGIANTFSQIAGRKCFYCGKMVVLPCSIIYGNDFDMVLHPGCAVKLKFLLDRDCQTLFPRNTSPKPVS